MNASVSLKNNIDLLSLIPPSTEQRLKSYGFTQGRIVDAVRDYLKSNSEIEANAFVSFAVNQFSSSSIVPHLWTPLVPTKAYLTRKLVSEAVIERCLSHFRGKKLSFKPESLDSCFIQYCLRSAANDKQTDEKKNRTYIPDDWNPRDSTVALLKRLIGNWTEMDWDIGEYRVYWIEAGGKKNNWDQHFISYMKKKYRLV